MEFHLEQARTEQGTRGKSASAQGSITENRSSRRREKLARAGTRARTSRELFRACSNPTEGTIPGFVPGSNRLFLTEPKNTRKPAAASSCESGTRSVRNRTRIANRYRVGDERIGIFLSRLGISIPMEQAKNLFLTRSWTATGPLAVL